MLTEVGGTVYFAFTLRKQRVNRNGPVITLQGPPQNLTSSSQAPHPTGLRIFLNSITTGVQTHEFVQVNQLGDITLWGQEDEEEEKAEKEEGKDEEECVKGWEGVESGYRRSWGKY